MVTSFFAGNTSVGAESFIQLGMTPSATYSTGGYIEVVAPGPYTAFSSNLSCFTVFGLTGKPICTRFNDTRIIYKQDVSSTAVISIIL